MLRRLSGKLVLHGLIKAPEKEMFRGLVRISELLFPNLINLLLELLHLDIFIFVFLLPQAE
jgi:hypothetical protein